MSRANRENSDIDCFARVLQAWSNDGDVSESELGDLGPALAPFEPCDKYARSATKALSQSTEAVRSLLDYERWIVGRPLDHKGPLTVPVVTARVEVQDSFVMAALRVGLLYAAGASQINAVGMRFESAEQSGLQGTGGAPPHLFPHMQLIEGWTTKGNCLVHPPDIKAVDQQNCVDCAQGGDRPGPWLPHRWVQTRPAVPLRCKSIAGVAVAALAATYGTHTARDILDTDPQVSSAAPIALREEISWILGDE